MRGRGRHAAGYYDAYVMIDIYSRYIVGIAISKNGEPFKVVGSSTPVTELMWHEVQWMTRNELGRST